MYLGTANLEDDLPPPLPPIFNREERKQVYIEIRTHINKRNKILAYKVCSAELDPQVCPGPGRQCWWTGLVSTYPPKALKTNTGVHGMEKYLLE